MMSPTNFTEPVLRRRLADVSIKGVRAYRAPVDNKQDFFMIFAGNSGVIEIDQTFEMDMKRSRMI